MWVCLFTFVINRMIFDVYNCKLVFVYICEMKKIDIEKISSWYKENHVSGFNNRYLTLDKIMPQLSVLNDLFTVEKIGESFEGRAINKVAFGKGKIKVFLWTQMHGNESTGTRAFLDLIEFFAHPGSEAELATFILNNTTIYCIPILNPDGAVSYTRVNAQGIDLNRDVIDMKAKESKLLQKWLKKIDPDFCFNLHDQRTIFSVAPDNKTATLSFLAPSVDKERSLNEGRKQTMTVIAAMNDLLQQFIPGQIGRYTDEFYPTATGDNFQKMGHNTILIESGHAKGDYKRNISRKATFVALLEGLRIIAEGLREDRHSDYLDIPNNEKKYLDVIFKDVNIAGNKTDIGVLFVEELIGEKVCFRPSIDKMENLSNYNADEIINDEKLEFENKNDAENWLKNRYI